MVAKPSKEPLFPLAKSGECVSCDPRRSEAMAQPGVSLHPEGSRDLSGEVQFRLLSRGGPEAI